MIDFKDEVVSFPVMNVIGQITHRAQKKYDCSHYPEWAIYIGTFVILVEEVLTPRRK
jgi:hypothetical protein